MIRAAVVGATGYAGAELFVAGHRDDLRLSARPRWPLDQTRPALLGGGRKGAKA